MATRDARRPGGLAAPARASAGRRRAEACKSHPALEAFAVHPDLAKAFFTFNRHVLWGTTLPHRLRHIVILRVAARREAAFVWGEHASQARDAGLTDEEIAAIASLTGTPFHADLEAALLQAVDELIDDGVIALATWEMLAADLTPPQLVDVVFTAGCYNTVASFTRSIELDADARQPGPAAPGWKRMKPAPFDYHVPASVDEAVELLASLGDSAKVLAGGQSLVPMLALRLAIFEHLVDLRRVEELKAIERRNGTLWVGAGTTQATVERSAEVA